MPKRTADSTNPMKKKLEEHEITHLPCRSWCWACVQGRGKAAPHRRGRQAGSILDLHLDFVSVGSKDEPGEATPCSVVREAASKMCVATAVPSKSVN